MKKCRGCGKLTERLVGKCPECKDKENARQREQYQNRLNQGLCPRCGDHAISDSSHCQSCSNRTSKSDKHRARGRLDKGICPQCGQRPCESGLKRCSVCRATNYGKVVDRETRLSLQGLCTRCGKNKFLLSMKDRTSRQRQCEACYLKRAAKNNLGSERFAQLLLDKLNTQHWTCPYTGDTIVLGDNDSVDHIRPRIRFPDESMNPDNVEWITRRANVMKRDLMPDEFLAVIKQIHDYRSF